MTEGTSINFSSYTHIPIKKQELLFAKNCLNYAKAYLKEEDPAYNIMAISLFATANMIYKSLKETH